MRDLPPSAQNDAPHGMPHNIEASRALGCLPAQAHAPRTIEGGAQR